MSTIRLHQTTTLTPEQYIAGLTDFGPGPREGLQQQRRRLPEGPPHRTDRRRRHRRIGRCLGAAALRLVRPRPRRPHDDGLERLGRQSGYVYTFGRAPNGATVVNVVITRQGKNAKGRRPRGGARERRQGRPQEVVRQQRERDRGPRQPDAGRTQMTVAPARRSDPPRGRGERGRHPRDGRAALSPLPQRRRQGRLPALGDVRRRGELGRRPGTGTGRQAGARDRDEARGPAALRTDPQQRHALGVRPRRRRRPTDCSRRRAGPGSGAGPPFGAAVWAGGYVVLPLLGVYQPIWKYDRETLEKDLSAHLVFGTATAATFWLLTTVEVDR